MSALDDLVGQVYMDRDSRLFLREVKVIGVEANGRSTRIAVETIEHPANPAAIGRRARVRVDTLQTRYRRVR